VHAAHDGLVGVQWHRSVLRLSHEQLLRVEADIPEVRILGSPYVHTTPDKPVYLKGQATTPCGEQFAGKSHVTSYGNI
jgi:hypothetical protein